MTVPQPTQPNKTSQTLSWYQIPVLWLSAGIFILTLLACGHLIILSLEKAPVLPSENHRANIFLPNSTINEADINPDKNRSSIEMVNE